MRFPTLVGRSILVIEDEALIALDIVETFRRAGASVMTAQKLEDGLRLAAHPGLSAAVIDVGLMDAAGMALCQRLKERRIPFIRYTGYSHLDGEPSAGVLISKPASPDQLVATVALLLAQEEAAP